MRIGIVLRNSGPDGVTAVRRVTDLAVDLGFDSVWASDHIVAPPGFAERYGLEWLDPFVSLAVAAERSETLTLGFSVLVVPYRAALPTARALATLQDLSGGRVVAGMGSGWLEPEFAALGEDFDERGAVTDERVAVIQSALGGERKDFAPPARPVPLLAGGNGVTILHRAARLGGWHPIGQTPTDVAAGARALPAGTRVALRTRLGLGRRRESASGHRPLFGSAADVAGDLRAYADAGVTDLVVDHTADNVAEMEQDLRAFA